MESASTAVNDHHPYAYNNPSTQVSIPGSASLSAAPAYYNSYQHHNTYQSSTGQYNKPSIQESVPVSAPLSAAPASYNRYHQHHNAYLQSSSSTGQHYTMQAYDANYPPPPLDYNSHASQTQSTQASSVTNATSQQYSIPYKSSSHGSPQAQSTEPEATAYHYSSVPPYYYDGHYSQPPSYNNSLAHNVTYDHPAKAREYAHEYDPYSADHHPQYYHQYPPQYNKGAPTSGVNMNERSSSVFPSPPPNTDNNNSQHGSVSSRN